MPQMACHLRNVVLLLAAYESAAIVHTRPCTGTLTSRCCGDDVCDGPETAGNCPADCSGDTPGPGPSPSGPSAPGGAPSARPCTATRTSKCCGDDVCDGPETAENCPADCSGDNPVPSPPGPSGPGPAPSPPGGAPSPPAGAPSARPCTDTRTSKCCGDDVCDGPETAQNCPADCSGDSPGPSPPGGGPSPPPSGPSPPGGACSIVPAEKPTEPTLCTEENQGCCQCGSGDTRTYVFWPGDGSRQHCFHAYNVPASAPADGPYPVVLHMDGYSGGRPGPPTQGKMGAAAKYYGFATITVGSLLRDGAGGFGLEFGNNGVVNDGNPTPCSASDSREIPYLEGIFAFIAASTSLDSGKVYTEGFSQNSMFAAYTAVCFADKVAGAWQGGSGLAKTGYDPVTPGKQAQCSFDSHAAHGNQCCSADFCTDCQYWPIYPKTCSNKLVDCIAAYTDDNLACGSDWYMYEAMVAEGNDARLLSFPAGGGLGGHKDPKNKWSWLAGCLGLVPSCSSACATSFGACVAGAAGAAHDKFAACEDEIKAGSLSGCAVGCAPTLEMLLMSEEAVVTLSEGKFGTEAGLPQQQGPAPEPQCEAPFGKFSDRAQQQGCQAPAGFEPQAGSPTPCPGQSPPPGLSQLKRRSLRTPRGPGAGGSSLMQSAARLTETQTVIDEDIEDIDEERQDVWLVQESARATEL